MKNLHLHRSLDVFIKVADLGSFTRAADALDQSRTAVSRDIAELEAYLGVRLLNRTTRRVSLTEAGERFLTRARGVVADFEEACREAASLVTRPRGRLRLNVPMSFGVLHVAPALPDFLAQYPEVAVDLVFEDRRIDLVEEGFDLAIRIGVLPDSSLVATRLADCRMVVCAAPAYLDRHGRPRHPDDLARHECLSYRYWSGGDNWRFERDGESFAVPVQGRMITNNGDALKVAAEGSIGIILQPSFIVGNALRRGTLERVLPDYQPQGPTIYAVYPGNRHVPAKVRVFIDHMRGAFGDPPYWDREN